MVPARHRSPPLAGEPGSRFVCPLCGATHDRQLDHCPRCGGNLVVPIEDRLVYRTILPLCGPRCDEQA